jgi:protein TonB
MTQKNHRKNPDRIILFEIGIIIALLLVNYVLNITYVTVLPTSTMDENILEDKPFQLVEINEPIEESPREKNKPKEIANLFNPRSMIKQVDDLFNLNITPSIPQTIPLLGKINPIVVQPIIDSATLVRDWADQMPEFPGGENALNNYIIDRFKIPDIILEITNSVEIVTQFIIDENGNIDHIEILHCSKPGFGVEEEVLDIYGNMPKWSPGKSKGKASKVRMKQPIKIKIR